MSLVREQREKCGLTMTELAELAGMTLSKLSRIEGGHRFLKVNDVLLLAQALKCQPSELIPLLPEPRMPVDVKGD
jgi:transcriptional regulator with XRE-family HTH domain